MKKNLKLFYHFCARNFHYKLWLDEQLGLIKDIGILNDTCDGLVNMTLIADIIQFHEIEEYLQQNYNFVNIIQRIVDPVPELKQKITLDPLFELTDYHYEGYTLNKIHEFCLSNNDDYKILYFHTKGIMMHYVENFEKFPHERCYDWRQLMQHFCLSKYENCVEKLDTYDLVSVNWRDHPFPHFSGNFWWATSKYIKTLTDPIDTKSYYKGNDQIRVAYEFWVASNSPNYYELHNSKVNHHLNCYPKINYT